MSHQKSRFKSVSCVIALIAFIGPLGATAATEGTPPPPYLQGNTEHVIAIVAYDEAAVRSMLPAGIEPVKEMTGGINIYRAPEGWGLAPYTAAYMWVDIEGFDSADGAKGRWILQGMYGPERVATALRTYYGFPVRAGESRLEAVGSNKRGIGILDGRNVIQVEVAPKPDSCQGIHGTLNYPAQAPSGKIVTMQIPVIAEVCGADPVSVEIDAPADDPVSKLKPVKVIAAIEVKKGYFSFSRPLWTP
jgi:hypothetical protein